MYSRRGRRNFSFASQYLHDLRPRPVVSVVSKSSQSSSHPCPTSFTTGKIAPVASGAVFAQTGNSVVLATAASTSCPSGREFLPLSVEFRTKLSALGRIPSGPHRREIGGVDSEILSSRLIDRALRPAFPPGYSDDTQIIATVQSFDQGSCDMDVLSINAAAAALIVSDIPFNEPVAAARVAVRRCDNHMMINPCTRFLNSKECGGHMVYAGTSNYPLMLEGSFDEWSESDIGAAMSMAHRYIQPCIRAQAELQELAGRRTRRFATCVPSSGLLSFARDIGLEAARSLISSSRGHMKRARVNAESHYYGMVQAKVRKGLQQSNINEHEIGMALESPSTVSVLAELTLRSAFRELALSPRLIRFDGRAAEGVRAVSVDTNILPMAHGSSLFSRGDTQTICSVTLGGLNDELTVSRGLEAGAAAVNSQPGDVNNSYPRKKFFLQYEFPPYCVNETGRLGGSNRRTIGHGALAEKALLPMVPVPQMPSLSSLATSVGVSAVDVDAVPSGAVGQTQHFPYTIRVTSEVSGSDGSSSMATVCGATAALQDAGVPLRNAVAGVSIGLVTMPHAAGRDSKQAYCLLTDILGSEDHHGDMDFKIAGTCAGGVTAVQLDMKRPGLPVKVLSEALLQARSARKDILRSMNCAGASAGQAPDIKSGVVQRLCFVLEDDDAYNRLVGRGGAGLRSLEAQFDNLIHIHVQKTSKKPHAPVEVSGLSIHDVHRCTREIFFIVRKFKLGDSAPAVVSRVEEYGAFVELMDGSNQSVLVSTSDLSDRLLNSVEHSVVLPGQRIDVVCIGEDSRSGMPKFSRLRRSQTKAYSASNAGLMQFTATSCSPVETNLGQNHVGQVVALQKRGFRIDYGAFESGVVALDEPHIAVTGQRRLRLGQALGVKVDRISRIRDVFLMRCLVATTVDR